jgi:hypothetical protein
MNDYLPTNGDFFGVKGPKSETRSLTANEKPGFWPLAARRMALRHGCAVFIDFIAKTINIVCDT